jgi:hypothetical protein
MTLRILASALLAASVSFAGAAMAEDAPVDKTKQNVSQDAPKSGEATPVQQLHLSEQLAAYGRSTKDPLSLIVAAQIRQGVGVKVVERKADEAAAEPAAPAVDVVGALLDEAKALSKNDKTIVALADDVKASATKGRVGGGIVSNGTITGRTIHNITMNFRAKQVAEIAAVGTDTNDIMLEVFDEGGHLICRDSDPAYCRFTPAWTGAFKVKVHNNGTSLSHYRLETN